ncbi:hypothetical protein [uncultured Sphingomonas sp.]|uniref:hypothetical protein n=1 Tax=uncultured Sphingomonas sp. TaxID=158754 RepID=UPI0025DE14C3|nr:hypothetical protein [uncultured Sphingomonas sp.]
MRYTAAALCLLATSAVGAESLPALNDYLSTIKADVTATGLIGINSDRAPIFVADGKVYEAQFALEREVLKAVTEQCQMTNMFMTTGLCEAAVDAELAISGPDVTLTIFAVRDLKPQS